MKTTIVLQYNENRTAHKGVSKSKIEFDPKEWHGGTVAVGGEGGAGQAARAGRLGCRAVGCCWAAGCRAVGCRNRGCRAAESANNGQSAKSAGKCIAGRAGWERWRGTGQLRGTGATRLLLQRILAFR